jgi:hypothetical protein
MVAAPVLTPVAVPVLASIVAMVTSLLLHAPPVVVLLSVLVVPLHIVVVPVMAPMVGTDNTVSIAVAVSVQPNTLLTM